PCRAQRVAAGQRADALVERQRVRGLDDEPAAGLEPGGEALEYGARRDREVLDQLGGDDDVVRRHIGQGRRIGGAVEVEVEVALALTRRRELVRVAQR